MMDMRRLPAEIKRRIATAPLPINYEAAKAALVVCVQVDEAKEWADKSIAIASYARQIRDKALQDMARRIVLRATRRIGELTENDWKARDEAIVQGMTKNAIYTARRIAQVPEQIFDESIEKPNVPSVGEYFAGLRVYPTINTDGAEIIDGLPRPDPRHQHYVHMKTALTNFSRAIERCHGFNVSSLKTDDAEMLRALLLPIIEILDEYEQKLPKAED